MASFFEQAEELRYGDNFEAAIQAYDMAIELCPNNPLYLRNRALCHIELRNWAKAEDDSRSAIEVDNTSAEAHSILGQALLEKTEYIEAVRELKKAFDLETGANPNGHTVEDIRQLLIKAKFCEWENTRELRSRELQHLREACVCALNEKHSREVSQMGGLIEAVEAQHLQQLDSLERVFSEAAKTDTPTEMPDYFRCPISYKVLRDPVITPSGHTYQREAILRHLGKVKGKNKRKKQFEKNNLDPISQEPLDSSQLVPNLAIKEAVEAFFDNHAWAYGELDKAIIWL